MMRAWVRGMCIAAGLVALPGVALAAADDGPAAPINAVLLLDDVPAPALEAALRVGPAWASEALRPTPAALDAHGALERLRWASVDSAGLGATLSTSAGETRAADAGLCDLDPQTMAARLTEADDELLFGDDQAALDLVLKVQGALGCAAEPADRELLARAWLMEGIARTKLKLAAKHAFRRAAAIWPEASLAADYSPEAQAAFGQAIQDIAGRASVTVTIDEALLADHALWIDGQQWAGERATIPLGPHFLQIVTADEALVAGAWVEASADEGAPSWPPSPLRPLDGEEISAQLTLEMGAPRPGEWQRRLAEDETLAGGWVVWISHDPLTEQTRVRWVGPEAALWSTTLRPQQTTTSQPRKPTLPIIAGVLGTTAAASLGAYAWLYRDVANTPHTADEIASLRRMGLIAEGVGIATGVSAVAVAGLALAPRFGLGGGSIAATPKLTWVSSRDEGPVWMLSLGGRF